MRIVLKNLTFTATCDNSKNRHCSKSHTVIYIKTVFFGNMLLVKDCLYLRHCIQNLNKVIFPPLRFCVISILLTLISRKICVAGRKFQRCVKNSISTHTVEISAFFCLSFYVKSIFEIQEVQKSLIYNFDTLGFIFSTF